MTALLWDIDLAFGARDHGLSTVTTRNYILRHFEALIVVQNVSIKLYLHACDVKICR